MNPFEYTNNDYKPRRRWIAGFSHKPSPLKVLFYTLLVLGAILLLGHLALKGLDNGNKTRCENWQRTSKNLKVYFSYQDYMMCQEVGINLQ